MKRLALTSAVAAGLCAVSIGVFSASAQGPGFRGSPSPLMMVLDTDQDGELSPEEIAKASASLKRLDRNGDGRLSENELRPFFNAPEGRGQSPEELVDQMLAYDKNKDGKLSRAELPERLRPIMARADTDGDGLLDRKELTAYARSRAANATEPREKGGPPRGGR